MIKKVEQGERTGVVRIPASKSYAHRYLICAALSEKETRIRCEGMSKDILATIDCLNALGADISFEEEDVLHVVPIKEVPGGECELFCGESGSTLRFMIPVVGALGASAVFNMEGRLPSRPLHPFDDELRAHGMTIVKDGKYLHCSGRLAAGEYTIPGDISSQYITGLLLSLPLVLGDSVLRITGKTESVDYIRMTEDVVRASGIPVNRQESVYDIRGGRRFSLEGDVSVEGDWSNAAFFLSIGALSEEGVTLEGVNLNSAQGDRRIVDILREFGADVSFGADSVTVKKNRLRGIVVDASMIPDLVPVISTVASVAEGVTEIKNAARLRLKESDRLETTADMLNKLGASVDETEDGLVIDGVERLFGGETETFNDHRIAMSAAVAATVSKNSVTVLGAECTEKSYPGFFRDLETLKLTYTR